MSEEEANAAVDAPAEGDATEAEVADTGNPVTAEVIGTSLSLLCKIGSGVAHAYVRCDLQSKELTDMNEVSKFQHLRYLDISKNKISDIAPLNGLASLLVVNAEQNELTSISTLTERRYLQVLNISGNKLTGLDGLNNHSRLEIVNASKNQIATLEGIKSEVLSRLRVLDLSDNNLQSTASIIVPSLESLYLGKNIIISLADLSSLKSLETLHLRGNKIESLSGLAESMSSLKYLNLRENNIQAKQEIHKLACLSSLETLNLIDNPVTELDDYRMEVLVTIPTLRRLDKMDVTPEERSDAHQIRKKREEEKESEAE